MAGITCPELLECTLKLLDRSSIAIGLWTIVFGIASAADVEYHSG